MIRHTETTRVYLLASRERSCSCELTFYAVGLQRQLRFLRGSETIVLRMVEPIMHTRTANTGKERHFSVQDQKLPTPRGIPLVFRR